MNQHTNLADQLRADPALNIHRFYASVVGTMFDVDRYGLGPAALWSGEQRRELDWLRQELLSSYRAKMEPFYATIVDVLEDAGILVSLSETSVHDEKTILNAWDDFGFLSQHLTDALRERLWPGSDGSANRSHMERVRSDYLAGKADQYKVLTRERINGFAETRLIGELTRQRKRGMQNTFPATQLAVGNYRVKGETSTYAKLSRKLNDAIEERNIDRTDVDTIESLIYEPGLVTDIFGVRFCSVASPDAEQEIAQRAVLALRNDNAFTSQAEIVAEEDQYAQSGPYRRVQLKLAPKAVPGVTSTQFECVLTGLGSHLPTVLAGNRSHWWYHLLKPGLKLKSAIEESADRSQAERQLNTFFSTFSLSE